jgi:hypothetical protein
MTKRDFSIFNGNPRLLKRANTASGQKVIKEIIDGVMKVYDETERMSHDVKYKSFFDQVVENEAGNIDEAKLSLFIEGIDETIMSLLTNKRIEVPLQDKFQEHLEVCYRDAVIPEKANTDNPDECRGNFEKSVREIFDMDSDLEMNSKIPRNV